MTQPDPSLSSPSGSVHPSGKMVEHPSPLTGVARSGIALAAVVAVLAREFLERGALLIGGAVFIAAALGVVALIGGISGLITWRTTTFVADDEEFRVEKNFINRSSSRVDYTKVQAIDIQQPFLARLLGLAKVHIDVGSGGGVELAYLTKDRAEGLRATCWCRCIASPGTSPLPPTARNGRRRSPQRRRSGW